MMVREEGARTWTGPCVFCAVVTASTVVYSIHSPSLGTASGPVLSKIEGAWRSSEGTISLSGERRAHYIGHVRPPGILSFHG
jgi:hypothetical protein